MGLLDTPYIDQECAKSARAIGTFFRYAAVVVGGIAAVVVTLTVVLWLIKTIWFFV